MSTGHFVPEKPLSKRFLFVGTGWFPTHPGGVERYTYELIHHLTYNQDTQDSVELCALDLPKTDVNLPIKLTNLGEMASSVQQRFKSARRNFLARQFIKPDAINLHFALYSFPLLDILPNDVPTTFTFHGPWALESLQEGTGKLGFWLKYWLEKTVHRRCDRFITLSHAFSQILHQQYGVPQEKITVIPGGVDLDRFQANLTRQEARQQLGWSPDRVILFTPRRLVQRMGLSTLLRAIDQMKSKVPEVWLAVAGKGSLRSTLEQEIQALGLEQQVRLLGFLPDEKLPLAYQAADLTVIPSQSLEGFGLVLAESLACGTPALCTPVGGMPETIAPLSSDLVTSSIHENAIAERLIELLTGQIALPDRLTCRNYAATYFNWQTVSQQVRSVLLS